MMSGGRIKDGGVSLTSKSLSVVTKSSFREVLRGGFDPTSLKLRGASIAEDFEFTVGAVFAGTLEVGTGDLVG